MRGERYRGIVFVGHEASEAVPRWVEPLLANAGLEPAEVAWLAHDSTGLHAAIEALAPKVLIAETPAVADRLREDHPATPVLEQGRARPAARDPHRQRRALELGLELRRIADRP